jgi:hypothetical protein
VAQGRERRMKRLTLLGFAAFVAVVVAVPAASPAPPTITHFPDFTGTATITDLCAFPIDLTFTLTNQTETDFTDNAGILTEIHNKFFEQDTFVANGHTLVGDNYSVTVRFVFDSSGNLTNAYGTGPLEKVSLPDGSRFFSQGRVDFVARGVAFVFTPDTGHSGNVAGFCAALAP